MLLVSDPFVQGVNGKVKKKNVKARSVTSEAHGPSGRPMQEADLSTARYCYARHIIQHDIVHQPHAS